jgi:hypothetical protein
MVAFDGDSAIDCNVPPVTVRLVEAFKVPTEAEMVVVPTLFAVTELLTPKAATAESDEVHCARLLTSRVLPSLKVPKAEKPTFVKSAIEGFAGKTAIETRFARFTSKVAFPLPPPKIAVTLPLAEVSNALKPCPIASPLLLVTNGGKELHEARFVTSWVELSLNVAVAANCC